MMDLKELMLDATNIAIESQRAGYDIGQRESAATINALVHALRTSHCIRPFPIDDFTVGGCVDGGHCGCDNKAALERAKS